MFTVSGSQGAVRRGFDDLIYGESHPNTAFIYQKLGSVYHHTGQYNQAKDLFEKGLAIHTSIYGQESTTVAHLYYCLGSVYNAIGKYEEAKRLHEYALTINT